MNTAILEKPTVDVMDIDLAIDVEDLPVEQIDQIRLTSISLCTPGCTSPNGGSGCSFCC